MTSTLTNWLSLTTMQSLGWALLHFLWQGTALAALAAAAMALCQRASTRYLLGVGALAVMLLAPFATFFYAQQHSGVADAAKSSPPAAADRSTARGRTAASGATQPSSFERLSNAPAFDFLPWLVEAWLLGVAFFSLRSAGGFFLLERERRKQSSVVSPRVLEICYSVQHRLGLNRMIAFFECAWLRTPAVIGWFRPVVFLPVTALSGLTEEQLELVIAHELAHVQRFDSFVNVFQVCVETVLFYHPAVWWLNKRIRAEREHCCDDAAVSLCGNAVEYARALTLMEEWRSAPVLAMAVNRGPLTDRIVRVLGLKTLGAGMRGIGMTGSVLCLTAALVAGNALLGIARPRVVNDGLSWQATTSDAAIASSRSAAQASASAKPSPAHAQASSQAADASSSSSSASSYIDAMKAAGLPDLTVDQLIALKVQDVTPEYVRELREQGLQLDANTLIAMRVQGVTPEYIRALHSSGLNPNQDQLIGLKVQGVTPEYVQELRAAGFAVTADKVIGMKVQDVTPQYVKSMRDLGLQLNVDEIIGMRVQDVSPEYVRAIQSLGFKPSVNELIGMKVQDVTPEYIKALQSAGYKVNVNEIIGAKVQDVTPEFIEQAKQHGFKDLTLQKLIRLRQLGILDSKADL